VVRKVMVKHNSFEEVIHFEGKWANIPEIKIYGARVKVTQDKLGRVYITVL